eukprot:gene249-biopygen7844
MQWSAARSRASSDSISATLRARHRGRPSDSNKAAHPAAPPGCGPSATDAALPSSESRLHSDGGRESPPPIGIVNGSDGTAGIMPPGASPSCGEWPSSARSVGSAVGVGGPCAYGAGPVCNEASFNVPPYCAVATQNPWRMWTHRTPRRPPWTVAGAPYTR